MKHLRLDLEGMYYLGDKRHATEVMRDLGITYRVATPQSMGACWHFWRCEGIPAKMPAFIAEMDLKPREMIGHGLSQADVDTIEAQ